jgi:type IV pilus assembly protein PilW
MTHCFNSTGRGQPTFQLPARQGGVSLVELMIGMTLSLLIVSAVGYVFAGSRQTYRSSDDNSRLQEGGRFAMEMLGASFRAAGHWDIAVADVTKVSFGATAVTGTNDTGANGTDTITLSFESATDCLGQAAPGGVAINTFRLNATNQLECLGNGANAAQALVDDVENFQVSYGIDTNADQAVDRYTGAPANWNQVIAAKVCVQLRSVNNGVAGGAQNFQTCGNALAADGAFDGASGDLRLRRTYAATFNLRNRVITFL